MSQNVKLAKKISAKTVIGKVKQYLPTEKITDGKGKETIQVVLGQEIPLLRVAGLCNKLKSGNSNFGEWFAFLGSFRAINLQTGEVFQGSELFLPEIVEALILPVVKLAMENDSTVELAFDIGAKANESEIGYEYTATPLLQMDAAANPAASLLDRLGPAPVVKALEAQAKK